MRIRLKCKGNWDGTQNWGRNLIHKIKTMNLDYYGKKGVDELTKYTPRRTGLTASSWSYYIEETPYGKNIVWTNSNVNKHVNIAMIIQYGHSTRNGVWIEGVDYINPALDPIFKALSTSVEKEIEKRN